MLPDHENTVRRVLVIDDNLAIHEDFKKILCPSSGGGDEAVDMLAAELFGDEPASGAAPTVSQTTYQVDTASQGQEGLAKVVKALEEGRPYQLAFVDMRMPPGWDGVETISQIWKIDPFLQTVICTAFSDYTWPEIRKALGDSDRLLILKKPFDTAEISQIASALTEKYHLAQLARLKIDDLESMIVERTSALRRTNDQLQQEVHQRRTAEEQLRHDVLHDRLTGLPNRGLLMERIEMCIRRQGRDPNYKFAALFIDMDDFKVVNDSLGHEAGDTLLVSVAERIASAVRSVDATARITSDELTSRLGGDEFVVLLDAIHDAEEARVVADRILGRMSEPFRVSGHEVVVQLSIGIAASVSPGQYQRAADVLRDADTAVYSAKSGGKRRVALFDSTMLAEARNRLELEQELRRAVDNNELCLHYQPIVCLKSGRLVGCEALLRWNHPKRGMVPPSVFIPLAEATGLMIPLGLQVCRDAARQLQAWRQAFASTHPNLWVSVNLSVTQLYASNLPDEIDKIIRDVGIDHAALRLEITEGTAIRRGDVPQTTLRELKARNLTLLMDDFGTGYSSLGRLHELPIGCIKIDRSFISELKPDNRQAHATVQAIVMLAHNFGFTVVAEGIEDQNQLEQIRSLNCDFGQGYLFSRAVPASEITTILGQKHPLTVGWDNEMRMAG